MIHRKNIQVIKKGDPKVIRGWIMYDWANSVYQLTIASTIFQIYYGNVTKTASGSEVPFFGMHVENTVLYSWAIAVAYFLIAVFSPLFASMADYTGRRKFFMKIFTWIGATGCGALFFFTGKNIEVGILAFGLGTLGYAGSLVFYNSFLPVIAEPGEQDRISARGYSMGYLGGVILLLFNLLMIEQPALFGIPANSAWPARISFLTVFFWWIGFSQITFLSLPKYTFRKRLHQANVLANGYKELMMVFRQVRQSARLSLFLVGFFFVMMGLLSVMYMAASYGQKEVGLGDNVLIMTVLLIQFVGMFGAWLFARISGRIGNLKALILAVAIWVFICIGAYFITNAAGFITAAFFIGLVMGGAQSLARSTYSKMLPETTDHTSFFSFYDVMEKLATVGGLFVYGLIEQSTRSMRYSIVAIGVFFLIGLCFLMLTLRKEKLTDFQSISPR